MSLVFEPGSKVGGHKAIRGLAGTQTARSPAGLRGTGPSPDPAPPGARPSILLEPGDPSPLRGLKALLSLPWGRNHAKRRRGHAAESVLRRRLARGVHSQRAPTYPRASGASLAGPRARTRPPLNPTQPLTHVGSQLRSAPPQEDSRPGPRGVGPTPRPHPPPLRGSGTPHPAHRDLGRPRRDPDCTAAVGSH